MLSRLQKGIVGYLLWNNTVRKPYVPVIHIGKAWVSVHWGLEWNVIIGRCRASGIHYRYLRDCWVRLFKRRLRLYRMRRLQFQGQGRECLMMKDHGRDLNDQVLTEVPN